MRLWDAFFEVDLLLVIDISIWNALIYREFVMSQDVESRLCSLTHNRCDTLRWNV